MDCGEILPTFDASFLVVAFIPRVCLLVVQRSTFKLKNVFERTLEKFKKHFKKFEESCVMFSRKTLDR